MLHPQILLVEDDADDRARFRDAFREAGYDGELKFVHSGEAALKYLHTLPPSFYPSLILLDFNTPGLNGAETLAQVRQLESASDLPVVFYSNSMRPLVKELLLAAGAAACLEKPDTPQGIREVVRSFLALVNSVVQLRR